MTLSDVPSENGGKEKELPFEEAFRRLEDVVRRLEGGDVTLDESLKLFEEGVGLARICAARLDAAEGKMKLLLGDGGEEDMHIDDVSGALG